MTIPWKVGETYKDIMERDYKLLYIAPETENIEKPLVFKAFQNINIVTKYLNGKTYSSGGFSYDIIPPEPEVEISDEVAKAFIETAYPNSPYDAADLPSEMKGIKAALTQFKKELEGK